MTQQLVSIITNDNKTYNIDFNIVKCSNVLKNFIEDECSGSFPLQQISSKDFDKILEYAEINKDVIQIEENVKNSDKLDENFIYNPKEFEHFPEKDRDFINKFSIDELINLTEASNFLDIPNLLDLCTHKIANIIQDKTTEEMRVLFGVVNDFEPGEEEKLRKELFIEN